MAIRKPWSFLQNPFLGVTSDSYRLAVRISTYHLNALKSKTGDAFFNPLISLFEPLHNNLSNAYNTWLMQGGKQTGNTLNVAQLLRLLSGTKVKDWDIALQTVYKNTSPEYKSLLPNRRSPFQKGSQTDRIAVVAALSKAIGSTAALQAVKGDIDTFYGQINTALAAQKSSITGTKTNSDAVEAARIAMCTAQYANLGALIQKYAAAPGNINQYFDLAAIRNGAQVVYTGDTKPGEAESIFKHTLAATDKLLLRNEGPVALFFYLAAQKDAAAATTGITVGRGETLTVTADTLGDTATQTWLNVYNSDTATVGEWTVEFV